MSKRPHIICHMASSIDGKIDESALRNVMRPGEYESLHSTNRHVWTAEDTLPQTESKEVSDGRSTISRAVRR
jgi:riboflavin biosynthesis pyrimidine reductase